MEQSLLEKTTPILKPFKNSQFDYQNCKPEPFLKWLRFYTFFSLYFSNSSTSTRASL